MEQEFVEVRLKKAEVETHVKEVFELATHQSSRERKRLVASTEPILRRYIAANPETELLNQVLVSFDRRITSCDLKANIGYVVGMLGTVLGAISLYLQLSAG